MQNNRAPLSSFSIMPMDFMARTVAISVAGHFVHDRTVLDSTCKYRFCIVQSARLPACTVNTAPRIQCWCVHDGFQVYLCELAHRASNLLLLLFRWVLFWCCKTMNDTGGSLLRYLCTRSVRAVAVNTVTHEHDVEHEQTVGFLM